MYEAGIDIEVRYTFREYRRFVLDHIQRQGHAHFALANVAVSAFAAVAFPIKRMRVGECRFHIDQVGNQTPIPRRPSPRTQVGRRG